MPLPRKFRYWPRAVFGFFLLTFSLYTIQGDRGLLHLWRLLAEKGKLDEKILTLQSENELLREKIRLIRHDRRYLEKVAREDLGLVRKGEIVYHFRRTESREGPTGVANKGTRVD